MSGFFPTSAAEDTPSTLGAMGIEIDTLRREIERMNEKYSTALSDINDLRIKISNAGGVVMDYYSENGELTDELKQIGELLGIPMTKRISGTAEFTISWSAQVPIDFDPEDFEMTFDVDEDNYNDNVEDFDWQEESRDISGDDE